jgi:hypothetical protein
VLLCAQEIKKIRNTHLIKNFIAAGPVMPFGNFSKTHQLGLSVNYLKNNNGFELLEGKKKGKTDFVYGGGAAIYRGKKEIVSLYPNKYPSFYSFYTIAGINYQYSRKTSLLATLGPGIGIYSGGTSFYATGKVEVVYFITKKIGIAPGLIIHQELKADPLASFSLKTVVTL